MKIITLWQPWASLIAFGLKEYETRSWKTKYRGKLAIHAAKRPPDTETVSSLCNRFPEIAKVLTPINLKSLNYKKCDSPSLPLGCIVAITNLTDCLQMTTCSLDGDSPSVLERSVGDWEPGRYAWKLENTIALPEPIPFTGGQGLRNLPEKIISKL